jgi:hypothetical protein
MAVASAIDALPREITPDARSSVELWPNMGETAALLRVSKATVSRFPLEGRRCGQERRFAPALLLTMGDHFQRREVGEVAAALIELARARAVNRAQLEDLEHDVAAYFQVTRPAHRAPATDPWLAEAQRRLPPELFEAVLHSQERIGSLSGTRFSEDEDG